MPSKYARTLLQITDDTARLCGDFRASGTNGRLYTIAEREAAVNDTVLDLVRHTGILKDVALIVLQEDQQVYSLPSNCLRLLRLVLHGVTGNLLLPKQVSQFDLERDPISDSGDPVHFFRDKSLAYNQIGFHPIPSQDGSSMTRDSNYGLLRRVTDSDSNDLPYDGNYALRSISGIPFSRSGDGNIIRSVVSDYGNVKVYYVRNPEYMAGPPGEVYPDSDLPEYIHKDIKYGAALRLLMNSGNRIHRIKTQIFTRKWNSILANLQRYVEKQGPMEHAYPV